MKNWTQYLKIWQKKRSEMQIDADAGNDWQDMRLLLDEHMPENQGNGKKRGISLFSIMMITLSAAAMVYVTAKVVEKRMQQHPTHHLFHHKRKGQGASDGAIASTDSAITLEDSTMVRTKLSDTAGDINIADTRAAEYHKLNETAEEKALTASAQKGTTNTPSVNAKNNNASTNKHSGQLHNGPVSNNTIVKHGRHITSYNANAINTSPGEVSTRRSNSDTDINTPNIFGQSISQRNAFALLDQPRQSFNTGTWTISGSPGFKPIALPDAFLSPANTHKDKTKGVTVSAKTRSISNFSFEWGVLIGANTQGSFTPKSQNSNFYGRLPVDAFTGLYGNFNVNEKWGVAIQARVLSAALVKGRYAISTSTHRIDTINVVTTRYINDSRKVYSVQVPLNAVYYVTNNIGLKAGPVFSFPVKQFSTTAIDSANRSLLTGARYDQKIDLGFSGGVSIRYKRLTFEATYLKGLTNHTVASDSLSYKARTSGTLQFTIGVQLGGKKK